MRYFSLKAIVWVGLLGAAAPGHTALIEITGAGDADGLWELSTINCDRTDTDCIAQLSEQVWYTDATLAEAFAAVCLDCLGLINASGNSGAYFNYIVPELPELDSEIVGYAYNLFVGVAAWFGGNPVQNFAIAERVTVTESSALVLLMIALLFGFAIRHRNRPRFSAI